MDSFAKTRYGFLPVSWFELLQLAGVRRFAH